VDSEFDSEISRMSSTVTNVGDLGLRWVVSLVCHVIKQRKGQHKSQGSERCRVRVLCTFLATCTVRARDLEKAGMVDGWLTGQKLTGFPGGQDDERHVRSSSRPRGYDTLRRRD
jgi:hypothetical protein